MSSTRARPAAVKAFSPPGPGNRDIRVFSLGLAAILTVAAGFQAWRGHSGAAVALGSLALVAVALGLLAPPIMRPVHRLFVRLGAVLGWINTRIILAAIFFLVFTPTGLVMRMMGRDPLRRRLDPESASYWLRRPPETRGPERYRKMY